MEVMYQERHVREKARRRCLSWIWAMTISTISGGSLVAGDEGVGEILLDPSAERVPRIRCKTRLVRSSITAAVIVVRRSSEEWAVSLPDNEDAGVFGCGIAISIWRSKSEETFVRRFTPRLGWSSAGSERLARVGVVPSTFAESTTLTVILVNAVVLLAPDLDHTHPVFNV
jgi:hypothetical protein